YKALFEMSSNRAEFVSRLFAKKQPANIGPSSTVEEIFATISSVPSTDEIYAENLKAITNHLTTKHGFPLSDKDLEGIEWVYSNFSRFGPQINYSSSGRGGFGGGVTYADLMTATDQEGMFRSYLANEANFNVLKSLEAKTLIVPVVGNFAGPRAIRAVGKYLKEKEAIVSAFY